MEENANVAVGEAIGSVFRNVTIACFVLCIILYFTKQFRVVSFIKNIFGWIFIVFGGLQLPIFVINLFYNNFFPGFVFSGVMFLVVGYLLKRWKLPVRSSSPN